MAQCSDPVYSHEVLCRLRWRIASYRDHIGEAKWPGIHCLSMCQTAWVPDYRSNTTSVTYVMCMYNHNTCYHLRYIITDPEQVYSYEYTHVHLYNLYINHFDNARTHTIVDLQTLAKTTYMTVLKIICTHRLKPDIIFHLRWPHTKHTLSVAQHIKFQAVP